jgi:hypothetical protein
MPKRGAEEGEALAMHTHSAPLRANPNLLQSSGDFFGTLSANGAVWVLFPLEDSGTG